MAYKDPSVYTYSCESVISMVEYMFNTKYDIWKDDNKLPKGTRETVGKLLELRDHMMYRGVLGWFFKKRNIAITEAIKEIAVELELASNAHRGIVSSLEEFKAAVNHNSVSYVNKNEFETLFNRVEILNEKIEQIKSSITQGV